VWKSVEGSSSQPGVDTRLVHGIREAVNFRGLLGRLERFTSFLIMNILEKPLSSTETIAKLVDKPVQIPV
jgi:hypothetical protein